MPRAKQTEPNETKRSCLETIIIYFVQNNERKVQKKIPEAWKNCICFSYTIAISFTAAF